MHICDAMRKQKREKYNFLMHRSWACNGENRRRHSRQPLQITNVLIGQFSLFNSFDSMSLQLNASYIHKYMRWIMDIERSAISYNVVYYCSWLLCRLMIADYVRFDSETVKWKTKFQIKVKKKKSNLRETFNVVPIDHFLFQFQLFFTIISINVCSFDDRFINLNCFILRKIPKILIFVTKTKNRKQIFSFNFSHHEKYWRKILIRKTEKKKLLKNCSENFSFNFSSNSDDFHTDFETKIMLEQSTVFILLIKHTFSCCLNGRKIGAKELWCCTLLSLAIYIYVESISGAGVLDTLTTGTRQIIIIIFLFRYSQWKRFVRLCVL